MTGWPNLDWLDAHAHDPALDADPKDEPNTKLIQPEPDQPEPEYRGGIAA